MNFAVIDIIFIGVIALFALRCAIRGLVSELFSVAAVVMGILSAIFFFRRGGVFVREKFMPDTAGVIPDIIAFAVIFLTVFAVIKILEVMLKNIVEGIHLDGVDRFLGFILGCAEGLIIVCLMLLVLSIQPLVDPARLLGKSVFAEMLLPFILGRPKEMLESVVILKRPGPGGV